MTRRNASRVHLVRPAFRVDAWAKLLLSGPEGSGKTRAALDLAVELAGAGEPVVIDTERAGGPGRWRALFYARDFRFRHLPWEPPYNPRGLGDDVAQLAGRYPVIVVDSASPFYQGEGGILDQADARDWQHARPEHRHLVAQLLECPAHVILCCRSRTDLALEPGADGRHVVRTLGLKPHQDDQLAYETLVHFRLSRNEAVPMLEVASSRCDPVPAGATYPATDAGELARTIAQWLAAGEPAAAPEVIEDLRARVEALPAVLGRECRAAFRDRLGPLADLRAVQVPDADDLVTRFEDKATAPQGPGNPPASASADRVQVKAEGEATTGAAPSADTTLEREVAA